MEVGKDLVEEEGGGGGGDSDSMQLLRLLSCFNILLLYAPDIWPCQTELAGA